MRTIDRAFVLKQKCTLSRVDFLMSVKYRFAPLSNDSNFHVIAARKVVAIFLLRDDEIEKLVCMDYARLAQRSLKRTRNCNARKKRKKHDEFVFILMPIMPCLSLVILGE